RTISIDDWHGGLLRRFASRLTNRHRRHAGVLPPIPNESSCGKTKLLISQSMSLVSSTWWLGGDFAAAWRSFSRSVVLPWMFLHRHLAEVWFGFCLVSSVNAQSASSTVGSNHGSGADWPKPASEGSDRART